MTDYTYQVSRLQDAYMSMQIAKKIKRAEIHAAHKKTLERIIRDAEDEIERDFARELHAANEAGLPGNVIRSEVLKTQDWGRWKKWRDLAQIEPDRVVAANNRAAAARANSPFVWAEDYSTLTVRRTGTKDLVTPVVYDMATNRKINGRWWPDATVERAERDAWEAGDVKTYRMALSDEIQSKIDAGLIPDPEVEA